LDREQQGDDGQAQKWKFFDDQSATKGWREAAQRPDVDQK